MAGGRQALQRRRPTHLSADARSRRGQAESRLPVDTHRRRAQHRLPVDARRVLVPPRCVDHRALESPAGADARHAADRPLRRRLRLGRESEARHTPCQRRLSARAFAGAGSKRCDPAERLHGQPRARRLRHLARFETHAPCARHPARSHARPAARRALRLPGRAVVARRAARQVHLAVAPGLSLASGKRRGVERADRIDRCARRRRRRRVARRLGRRIGPGLHEARGSTEHHEAACSRTDAGRAADDSDHRRRCTRPRRQRQRLAARGRCLPDRARQPRARGRGDGGGRQAVAADRDAGRPHAARRRELHAAHRSALPGAGGRLARGPPLARRTRRERMDRDDARRSRALSFRGSGASHRQRRPSGHRCRPLGRDLGRSRDLAAVGRDAGRGRGCAAARRSRADGFSQRRRGGVDCQAGRREQRDRSRYRVDLRRRGIARPRALRGHRDDLEGAARQVALRDAQGSRARRRQDRGDAAVDGRVSRCRCRRDRRPRRCTGGRVRCCERRRAGQRRCRRAARRTRRHDRSAAAGGVAGAGVRDRCRRCRSRHARRSRGGRDRDAEATPRCDRPSGACRPAAAAGTGCAHRRAARPARDGSAAAPVRQ